MATHTGAIHTSVDGSILKSPNDKNDYYVYTLSNKMNVVIINNKDADMSCVAMLVKIGYMHDTIPGIAHFLEHMLFNGTEKYPKEGYFSDFITKNNGGTNAYTASTHTCYYYTIPSTILETSLDIFSQFFTNSLLKKESVAKEKEAVNSEHVKNMASDAWRLQEVQRKACVDGHPLSKFGTGSNKTLDVPDIHDQMRNFYEKHYSSDLMTLIVFTKNDPNETFKTINSLFTNVPLRITEENRFRRTGQILQHPKTIHVVPVMDINKISYSWEIPSFYTAHESSPITFLSGVFGHEGNATLYNNLFTKGYISELRAGPKDEIYDRTIFSIEMELTNIGKQNINSITDSVFAYIEMAKSSNKEEHMKMLYNEQLEVYKFEFRRMQESGGENTVLGYCSLLATYEFPLYKLPSFLYTYEEYSKVRKNIYDVLNTMTEENVVVLFCSKLHEGNTKYVDENYGTKYNILDGIYTDYSQNEYIKYNRTNAFQQDNQKEFDLYPINPYISTNEKFIEVSAENPIKLNKSNMHAYWLPVNKFSDPDVQICALIDLPNVLTDVETHTASLIYFSSILAKINCEKYLFETANYRIDVLLSGKKLSVNIAGNSGKINLVTKYLVSALLDKKLIDSVCFENIMHVTKMSDLNFKFLEPYKMLSTNFSKEMCDKFYSPSDRLKIIDDITIEYTANVIDRLLESVSVTLLVAGNSDEKQAYEIAEIFDSFVKENKFPVDDKLCDDYKTPTKDITNLETSLNIDDRNSALSLSVFIDKISYGITKDWNKTICLLNIFDNIVSSDYYDKLRTQEQYGYVVGSSKKNVGDSRYMSKYYTFLVQSPHKNSNEIKGRTIEYIKEFKNILLEMTDEEFREIVKAKITSLLTPHKNLIEMVWYIFSYEIETGFVGQNLKKILFETYNSLTKQDLINFYDDKFLSDKKLFISIGIDSIKN